MHTLSVISVALNEAASVARLKQSLDALHRVDGVKVETLLVDGGSRDATVETARSAGFDHVLVHPGASIPTCRNLGARAATGGWLAYVDADCEVAADWLEQAVPFLAGAPPGIIGWPALPPENSAWVPRAWQIHWACKHRAARQDGAVISEEAFRLLTTRNLLLHREVFDALHGFDERLATGEDTDFVFRASGQGFTVLGVPMLHVIHHGEPATLREFFRQQLWHANRTRYAALLREQRRRGGAHAPLFATLFLALGLLGVAGLITAVLRGSWLPLLAWMPWTGLILGPAFVIARRAGSLVHLLPLSALYATYGLARALDLAGFHRNKGPWKN